MPPKKGAAAKGKGKGKRKADSESDYEEASDSDVEVVAKPAGKKRRAPATGKGKQAAGVSLEALVGRLGRAALEGLLVKCIAGGDAPTREDVEALLAPAQLGKYEAAPKYGNVEAKESLVDDGPFKDLDKEMTLRIFDLLNLRDKLVCVSEVCKGWRSLRKEPALWKVMDFANPDATRWGTGRILRFSDAGLRAMLLPGARSPLPAPTVVERLILPGGTDIKANSFKSVLKALTALTHLSISGKKLSETVIGEIAKGPGKQLVQLSIGQTASASKVKPESFLELFNSCPHLESLALAAHVSNARWFREAAERSTRARQGGASLIRSFSLGADRSVGIDWDSGCTLAALPTLGLAFPELEELALASVYPNTDWGWVFGGGDGGGGGSGAGGAQWTQLPRLRTAEVKGMGSYFRKGAVDSASCNSLLAGLAGAAPALRVLSVTRGHESGGSKAERAAGWLFKPIPRISAGLAAVLSLAQLEELSLGYMRFEAADCALVALPSLTKLSLDHCGSGSAAAALAIASGAPKLRSLSLAQVALCDENAAAPGAGIAGILPAAAAAADGGDEDAAAPSPLAGLTELKLSCVGGYGAQMEPAASCGSAVADPPAAYATVLRTLATRRLCPAVRSLKVSYFPNGPYAASAFPPGASCFAKGHPWAELETLECIFAAAALGAALAHLAAPALAVLDLPQLKDGKFHKPNPSVRYGTYGGTPKEALQAYEAARKACPKLPELTEAVSEMAAAAAAAGGEEGAAGGRGAAGAGEGPVEIDMDD